MPDETSMSSTREEFRKKIEAQEGLTPRQREILEEGMEEYADLMEDLKDL